MPNWIRERRLELRLTQAEAANLADVSELTWANVENGKEHSPKEKTVKGMCHALKWTTDSFDRIRRGEPPRVKGSTRTDLEEVLEVVQEVAQQVRDLARRFQNLEERLSGEPESNSP